MKVALVSGHVGSSGTNPAGNFGGGEAATFGMLAQMIPYYDVTLVTQNGVYPDLDGAVNYGYDIRGAKWRTIGKSVDWLRAYDVMISLDHHILHPPILRHNILYNFFPQNPRWNTDGYQQVVTISEYSKDWIKRYWGKEAEVVYPAIPLQQFNPNVFSESALEDSKPLLQAKKNKIVAVGRFFNVPGGNNKRHDVLIEAFKSMELADWQLVLIGSVLHREYYNEIRKLAGDDHRIIFRHDLNREEYIREIQEATFCWSATGYSGTGDCPPSGHEHFGIFVHECHAAGTVVLAHNSGGPAEWVGNVWENPEYMAELTRKLITGDDLPENSLCQAQESAITLAQLFARQSQYSILDILAEPILIPPSDKRGKVYFSQPKPKDIKIGFITDSPRRDFGFGVVARSVINGLMEYGYRAAVLGMQDKWTGRPPGYESIEKIAAGGEENYVPIWRGWPGDDNAWSVFGEFLDEEKPDILYVQYDIGNVRRMLDMLSARNIPLIAHVPVEGEPIIDALIETLRLVRVMGGDVLFYTKWAQEAVIRAGGPTCKWVHLGGDHADFAPLEAEDRKRFRDAIGWDDKIVLFFGGRNKRTKGFPALFSAMRILEDKHPGKFLMYCHTNPHDHIPNSSYPLEQIRDVLGLTDCVLFPPDLLDQGAGVGYNEIRGQIEAPETDDLNEVYAYNLSGLTLVERMGCADLFVCASEVEGFNLWLVEAMGCGLPIICAGDRGVQEEIVGPAGVFIPVNHWDMWHTGARLAQIDPKDLAACIASLVEKPMELGELDKMGRLSLERYQQFAWGKTCKVIHEIIQDLLGYGS